MTKAPEKSQGRILECIGFLLLVVALTTFIASVITHPSLQCGGECSLAGLYSTFTYMVAGFNVLLSLALIFAGRHLKHRLQSLG
ncbi:hypothetical protein [Pseudomonas sp. PLMAX]|uniref:hypothetical protein n=1 Tax=Pseudomonas sp. PLMAX TaxID=2201998 RepID=UPI0038B7564F